MLILIKELLFSGIFMNDLTDSNQLMQSTWKTGVAKARFEFSGEARFQIFTHK